MPAPVCPIGFQDLILQIRLNRGRSQGGEAEIVSLQQQRGAGEWGEGHRAPHATCESIRRPVCKLKKSRRLWGCRHHYSQESSNTEKCNWEFSFELKTLTCIINIHMLTILQSIPATLLYAICSKKVLFLYHHCTCDCCLKSCIDIFPFSLH